MTTLGWIFFALSMTFVWGLTGWCFYRVLTAPPAVDDSDDEDPQR